MLKYPIESDFIQSYLNLFVIGNFIKNNQIYNDAAIFNSCVHLNTSAFNLANCSDRRDKVDKFINENEELFNKYKNVSAENCQKELLLAHNINAELEKDSLNMKASERNFLNFKEREATKALYDCVKNNLS
jgi:hypothetical protein